MTRLEDERQVVEDNMERFINEPQCWMNAIIVCTKPGSRKHTGILANLAASKFENAPVIPMTPHHVAETDFNHFTTRADLVAAMKTLQAPQDPRPMVHHATGDHTIFQIGDGESVIVANDVMLDIRRKDDRWLAHNKPDALSSRGDIFTMLTSMVSPVNAGLSSTIDARIRVGAAAFCANSRRGIAGTTEKFMTLEPLDTNTIRLYMSNYPISDLLNTNAGLRWEDPILSSRIRSINGIPIDDPRFSDELSLLLRQAQGSLPEIDDLLTQANRFRLSGATGQLHEVTSVARDVLPKRDAGSWGVWYT